MQYQQPLEYQRPPPIFSGMGMQSNGMIMVDPMQNVTASDGNQVQPNSKKNRKNRKKNKNKTEEENMNEQSQQKIVTLRNPLFGANDVNRTQPPMPLQQRNQVPLNINQPASIIKNDNGMFTIRNMALHQALSNGVTQNYRPYASEMYQPQEIKPDNYSYFSSSPNHPPPLVNPSNSNPSVVSDVLRAPSAPKPSTTAIGSERSLRKQQQSFGSNINGGAGNSGDMFNPMHMEPKRPYSAFDMSANYGFNSDFIGSVPTNAQIPSNLQNQYYQVNGGFPFNNQTPADNTNSLFGSRTPSTLTNSHICDNSPTTHEPYGGVKTTDDNSYFKKFEDDSILHGLHPGQRLNSEVNLFNFFFYFK